MSKTNCNCGFFEGTRGECTCGGRYGLRYDQRNNVVSEEDAVYAIEEATREKDKEIAKLKAELVDEREWSMLFLNKISYIYDENKHKLATLREKAERLSRWRPDNVDRVEHTVMMLDGKGRYVDVSEVLALLKEVKT